MESNPFPVKLGNLMVLEMIMMITSDDYINDYRKVNDKDGETGSKVDCINRDRFCDMATMCNHKPWSFLSIHCRMSLNKPVTYFERVNGLNILPSLIVGHFPIAS